MDPPGRLDDTDDVTDALTLLAHLNLSAASGLVVHAGSLFTVADNRLAVLRTTLEGSELGLIPLRPGTSSRPLQKRDKPDFEAVVAWGRTLLVLGSGSGPGRSAGVQLDPDTGAVRVLDLSPLYRSLGAHLSELNIEGGVVVADQLILAQRGNGAGNENALVLLDCLVVERELHAGALTGRGLRQVLPVRLGTLGGVPLSLTDVSLLPSADLVFTAAAEATSSPWEDGAVEGSVIGVMDCAGQVASAPLAVVKGLKLEGVCVVPAGQSLELRLVADPDDDAARAPLFRLPWPPGA
jgi:hypothetical protein